MMRIIFPYMLRILALKIAACNEIRLLMDMEKLQDFGRKAVLHNHLQIKFVKGMIHEIVLPLASHQLEVRDHRVRELRSHLLQARSHRVRDLRSHLLEARSHRVKDLPDQAKIWSFLPLTLRISFTGTVSLNGKKL